jgi:hypothetical protein
MSGVADKQETPKPEGLAREKLEGGHRSRRTPRFEAQYPVLTRTTQPKSSPQTWWDAPTPQHTAVREEANKNHHQDRGHAARMRRSWFVAHDTGMRLETEADGALIAQEAMAKFTIEKVRNRSRGLERRPLIGS